MKSTASSYAAAVLVSLAATSLSCHADSFSASSASSAGSASIGSLSDSLRTSSGSSTRKAAEGDHRIVEVGAGERPGTLRLTLEPLARAGEAEAVILLDVPRAALADRTVSPGGIVAVRQRPYGYQFAWADTGAAFFLVLADDWHRDMEPRPVGS